MPEHPCANGLSSSCFKAYPKWARQVLAYKLLHIILPKQLTRRLPIGLGHGFFQLPSGWQGWLEWCIAQGLEPGDALPPGWNPNNPPPEIFPPGYDSGITNPNTGPEAPIFVRPFEPGPVRGQGFQAHPPFDVGDLLATLNTHALSLQLGYGFVYYDRALAIETSLHAEIHAIDAMVGRVNSPIDSVNLQIWTADGSYQPSAIVAGGTSEDVLGSSLPVYDTFQDYVRFLFYDKPILLSANKYAVVAHRTGDNGTSLYYRVGTSMTGTQYTYARLLDSSWWPTVQRKMIYKLWGKAL